MNEQTIYFNLSAPFFGNIFLPKKSFRGSSTVNFVLTGVNEEVFDVLFLDLTWGDKTLTEFIQKDLLFNYREKSIFEEMKYSKPGGSIATIYKHTFTNTQDTVNTSLTSVLELTFNNGVITRFVQPIDIYDGSFYDEIANLSFLKTQILPHSSNNLFTLLEGQNNKTAYVALIGNTSKFTKSTDSPITPEFIPRSFRTVADDGIDSRITTVAPGNVNTSKLRFITVDNSTATYIRNPACWANDVDLTGLPVFNSQTNNNRFCGSLITRRHVINAAHANPEPGSILRFVDESNNVYTRTILSRQSVVDTDINLCVLDSDLPSSIKSYKIMPKEVLDLIPDNLVGSEQSIFNPATRTAIFTTDQELKALVKEHVHNSYGLFNPDNRVSYMYDPLTLPRSTFSEAMISGDSGSATGFIIDGELIILSAWLFTTSGPRYGNFITQIQSVINSLNAANNIPNNYEVELFDLSGFTI
jgi:hypothetical protein